MHTDMQVPGLKWCMNNNTFSRVAVQMGGCRVAHLVISSVIYLSEQTTHSTSEAGDLLVTTVSNMSNVQLSLKDFESCQLMRAPHRSEARGVRECGGQQTGIRDSPASSLTTFKTAPCISSLVSLSLSLLISSPPSVQALFVYYISPTQGKWTLSPSTSRIWAALRHSDVQTERPMRQWCI